MSVARDTDEFIAALDNLDLGTAAYALPDWSEGDERWRVMDVAMRRNHRTSALDYIVEPVREEIETRYRADLRGLIENGVPRTAVASALGLSLAELRALMRWP